MKKSLLALSLALFTVPNLYAQEEVSGERTPAVDQQKVRFGAFIAPNLSWMKPANSKSNDGAYNVSNNGSKMGFTWGLMMDYWFADNYAIATGLQVNGTGGNIRAVFHDPNSVPPNTVGTADFKYSLQYLELPVNLKLKTAPLAQGISFFGQAGVTLGANIGKKATYTVTDGSTGGATFSGDKEKLSGTLSVAPVMLQMNLGIGAQYPFSGKLTAYVGLFYNNGFTPDATNPAKYNLSYTNTLKSFSDGNVRLNNFALRLGLFF